VLGLMLYRLSADAVLVIHLAFVGFVVLGALLVVRWPKVMPFHIVALIWGLLIEFAGLTCPLTPLEVRLRELGGEEGYEGGFIEHYITSLLYPSGLTRGTQIWLGFLVLVPNVLAYGWIHLRKRRQRRARQPAR
jgi:hypothetical protein